MGCMCRRAYANQISRQMNARLRAFTRNPLRGPMPPPWWLGDEGRENPYSALAEEGETRNVKAEEPSERVHDWCV